MHTRNNAALVAGLISFMVTLLLLISILTIRFLYIYYDILVDNNVALIDWIKLTGLTLLTFVSITLPIAVLLMSCYYYRHKYKSREVHIKEVVKSSIPFIVTIAILSFLFVSFVAPKAHLNQYSLLFDLRSKKNDHPLVRSEVALFEGSSQTSNILTLYQLTDTAAVTATFFYSKQKIVIDNRIQILDMLTLPVLLYITFNIGMLLGILNRKKKYSFLLLVGIYFVVSPSIYYLIYGFKALAENEHLTPLEAKLYLIALLITMLLLLFKYTNRRLKINQ